MPTTTDGFNILNKGPGSYPTTRALKGGRYALSAISASWGGGSVTVQRLAGDNSTYVNVPNATLSANGLVAFDAPAGNYQIVVATATGVAAAMTGIPT